MIRIEHRTVPARARTGGTWKRTWKQATSAVATHVTVHCDGRISELAACPRKILTTADNGEAARQQAAEKGWECGPESTEDYCPGHRRTPPVPSPA